MQKALLFIVFSLLLFPLQNLPAQILGASVKAGGLTCSQCSRSVEMAIRKLPFVEDVQMDLEGTESLVTFKKGVVIDFAQLAQAPRDAGFATVSVKVKLDLAQLKKEENCFRFDNQTFVFMEGFPSEPSQGKTFRIIAKGFLSNKELKQIETSKVSSSCSGAQKYFLLPAEK